MRSIVISLLLALTFIQQISSRHLDTEPQSHPLRFQSPHQIDSNTFKRARSNALQQTRINDLDTPNEKPCCYPKTWQGIMYRYPSVAEVEYFVTFYEDDVNQKMALDIVTTLGNATTPSSKVSQIIQTDAASKKVYVYQFDKAAKKCERFEFDNITYDQVTGHCIPDDAFYAGVFTQGIPQGGANLALRSWMWKPLPDDLPDLRYERLVTSDCAPVLAITRGSMQDKPVLQSDYYFNIQTSITDPTVFNLPDYCKQGVRKHYISASKAKKNFVKNWMKANKEEFGFFQL